MFFRSIFCLAFLILQSQLVFAGSKVKSNSSSEYTCYFWQPDEIVEEILVSRKNNLVYRDLKNSSLQAFFIVGDWGIAVGQQEKSTREHLASAKSVQEVTYRNYHPDFSISCYLK